MAVFNLGVIAGFFAPVTLTWMAAAAVDGSTAQFSIAAAFALLCALPIRACRDERLFWWAFLHAGLPLALMLLMPALAR